MSSQYTATILDVKVNYQSTIDGIFMSEVDNNGNISGAANQCQWRGYWLELGEKCFIDCFIFFTMSTMICHSMLPCK